MYVYEAFTTASIYTVHDEVKDKEFELELSWVGEGVYMCAPAVFHCLPFLSPPEETGGLHQVVSEAMKEDAIEYAKVSHGPPCVQLPFILCLLFCW